MDGSHFWYSLVRWFDSDAGLREIESHGGTGTDWVRVIPLIGLHLACLAVIWVGWSWAAVGTAVSLYLVRMFAITGFYHRYFSHNAFKASRAWTFAFAVLGNTAVQRGPLWWASHHRHHHRHADTAEDIHSPAQHGFWWSHIGWLTSAKNFPTKRQFIRDWAKYPELLWINRYDTVIPIVFASLVYLVGVFLGEKAPHLGTNGPQMLVWGFFISTVALLHATSTINSLDHMYGSRRYANKDTSRNNWLLALITLGEGWHNNHHHYAVSARQGFFWWEADVTYYVLVFLSWCGIVKDLSPLPPAAVERNLVRAER